MGFSILVVEDDAEIRETIQELLETRHYRVDAVSSADEALSRLSSAHGLPSLILLDRILSHGMSGDEMIGRLKADPRLGQVPVLMMSGSRGDGSTFELRKPFSVDELLLAVERILAPGLERQA